MCNTHTQHSIFSVFASFLHLSAGTLLIVGHDGTVVMQSSKGLLWINLFVAESRTHGKKERESIKQTRWVPARKTLTAFFSSSNCLLWINNYYRRIHSNPCVCQFSNIQRIGTRLKEGGDVSQMSWIIWKQLTSSKCCHNWRICSNQTEI